ncbi:MAG: hypothetical protein HYY78_16955 [Betaproteobacteria bacterium]|nr:hypothetical protein [Betaproteobacteria bacterium]
MPLGGLTGSVYDAIEYFYSKPWADGLPVVPPTAELVAAMLKGTRRDPNEELGLVPPNSEPLTVRRVAEHAVMAGARPEYMPVIIGGMQAILDEKLNMQGVQTTLHGVAPLLIFNGPYARKIGINGARGCFGPGHRANATIGRSVRLILYNVGGGYSSASFSCFGAPARYSYCIRENEEDSPWKPLSVDRGFRAEQDVVTAVQCDNPQLAHDDTNDDPQRLHLATTDCMANMGGMNAWRATDMVVALAPGIADNYAKAGMSKAEVHQLLREKAGKRVGELKQGGLWRIERLNRYVTKVDPYDDNCWVPTIQEPSRLFLIVAGGRPGTSTAVMHGWNETTRGVSIAYEV